LDRRLFGTQSRSRHGGGEKNSQRLPGLEPPIIQVVAQRYTTVWRELHVEELRNLYASLNSIGITESGRIRWVEHVARIGEM
jgi:hypothetical protein